MLAFRATWILVLLCMALSGLCGPSVALAQARVTLDGRATYDIAGKLEMHREPDAVHSIDDVLSGRVEFPFAPLDSASIALGQTGDAIWFRARMHNASPQGLKVNWAIAYIFLEQIDFYHVRNGKIIDHLLLGKVVPYSARRVEMDAYVFPMMLNPGEDAEVYWRIKSGVPMLIPFMLVNDAALAKYDGAMSARIGIYVGIMAGMAFYNLFLFFAIRDRAYLYYVLFIAFGTLVQIALLGALDKFTPEAVMLNRMNGNLSSSLALIFGILFSIRMLEIEHLPRIFLRVMHGFVIFFALCFIGALLNVKNVHVPLTVGVGFMSLLVWSLAVFRVRQGSIPARYFLTAWTVWTFGAVVATGLYVGLCPYNHFTLWMSPVSSAVLATFLSFSLAAYINLLRKQQLESAISAQKAHAENAAKGQFLAQMSHEIRTPMNGVLGMADLLRHTPLDAQQQQYLDIISNSGKALLAIINDILDFSKIAAGKMELDVAPIDLEKLISDSLQLFALPVAQKGIYLRARWSQEVPAIVLGDSTRIRQILTNLLSNAYKFTEKGGITVDITVQPVAFADEAPGRERLRISVTDTGIGISPENQARLFQAFNQAEASTTRRFGGTGLGLAICRQLAELMGGEVGVSSQEGQGSTFWFSLSLAEVDKGDLLAERERQLAALRALKLAFVTDDDALNPVIRLMGSNEPCLSWSQCEVRLAAANPDWVVAVAATDEQVAQVESCLKARRQTHWLVLVPLGIGMALENRLRDAGAHVVSQPVLAQAVWHVLAQTTLQSSDQRATATLKGHVLVAEDNAVNQKVITSMLKKLGLTCDVVENGKLAVERALEHRRDYTLVLMDCEMPEMDGYEAASRIRQYEQQQHVPQLPIIALSAHVMSEHLQAVKACGMNDALAKPINIDTLRETLQRHLAA